MRISTNQIYSLGKTSVQEIQSSLYRTQQQISTGREVLVPADDPVASAQALNISQSKAVTDQMIANQEVARDSLSQVENRLAMVMDVLQYARQRAVEAGNGSYSDAERKTIATDLREQFDQLLDLANSVDGTGRFLFAGNRADQKPFLLTTPNAAPYVSYTGDDGRQALQVSGSRVLPITESGSSVFERIPNGNGTFTTTADSGNTGAGVIDLGSVTNQSAWTGHDYEISFSVSAGTTTYSIVDQTSSTTLVSGAAYTSGQAITTIPGISFTVSGSPADTDSFAVAPSTNQSIFQTVRDLIGALENYSGNTADGKARLQMGLDRAMADLDHDIDNISSMQAAIGSRQKEVDDLATSSTEVSNLLTDTLSRLTDLDYADAITRLSRDQVQLEAAQRSFLRASSLNLFSLL